MESMEISLIGLIGTALVVIIPTAFLLILYIQTASRQEAEE
ncbi:Photosystem II reaction center protein M [Thalassoporum mexicanum PCC 7367]|nr:Photosystem II reaction center protein M [Pseudanabaena sp. PCC 7367]